MDQHSATTWSPPLTDHRESDITHSIRQHLIGYKCKIQHDLGTEFERDRESVRHDYFVAGTT